tara:strand:+ start:52360 stop:53193 length:834 start_codon:yes stop_codon:yes gene_type:complete
MIDKGYCTIALLSEDEEFKSNFKMILEDISLFDIYINVETFDNSLSAEEFIKQKHINLTTALVDLNIEQNNNFNFCRILRDELLDKKTEVYLTGNNQYNDCDMINKYSLTGYMRVKEFTSNKLSSLGYQAIIKFLHNLQLIYLSYILPKVAIKIFEKLEGNEEKIIDLNSEVYIKPVEEFSIPYHDGLTIFYMGSKIFSQGTFIINPVNLSQIESFREIIRVGSGKFKTKRQGNIQVWEKSDLVIVFDNFVGLPLSSIDFILQSIISPLEVLDSLIK